MNNYEAKIEAKREKYAELAIKAKKESEAKYEQAHNMASFIPFGQPILVGHHSEKRDRNFRDKIHNTFGKSIELEEKAKYYGEKAAGYGTHGISQDNPEAVTKLKEKIEKLEAQQEKCKAINKAIKKSDDEGLRALGLTEEQIIELKTPDFCGRIGMPAYALTNNLANIRRLKQRIEQLQAKANDITARFLIGEIEIIDNVEDNRLQIFFPSIPSEGIRTQLKSFGFRWSPTNKCWQSYRKEYTKQTIIRILREAVSPSLKIKMERKG